MDDAILVIEDDEVKLDSITKFLQSKSIRVCIAKSFNSGLNQLISQSFSIIILDMSLPTYDVDADDGGRPQPFGGFEILRQMKRRKMPGKVIVLTQFDTFGFGSNLQTRDQLAIQLNSEFENQFIGISYYSHQSESWKQEVEELIGAAKRGAK